jgi:hypothetical protein
MTAKDEAAPGATKAPGRPVYVDLAYAPGHRPVRGYDDISLDERIALASHKPLGAYLAQRTPEGWRWVPGSHRIGLSMARVVEYVMDRPGCTKSDAAWASRSRFDAWPVVNRVIAAGLVTVDYAHWSRCRLFACGWDRRSYYGVIPAAEPDGFWHTPAHP